MTLDELCARARATPQELDRWSDAGYLGDRWRERRDQGKWRHTQRVVAQRAVLFRRMLDAGLSEELASSVSRAHELSFCELDPIKVEIKDGIVVYVARDRLP